MREHITETARQLIREDTIVDGRVRELFGHNKPFGNRWAVRIGSKNLVPETVLTRTLEFPSQQETEGTVARMRFEAMYMMGEESMSWGLVDLFSDRENVSITGRLQHGSTGIIDITERPDQDHPTSLRSGDLGRMMLVDEFIVEQGIRTNNIRQMGQTDAELVLSNVGNVRI